VRTSASRARRTDEAAAAAAAAAAAEQPTLRTACPRVHRRELEQTGHVGLRAIDGVVQRASYPRARLACERRECGLLRVERYSPGARFERSTPSCLTTTHHASGQALVHPLSQHTPASWPTMRHLKSRIYGEMGESKSVDRRFFSPPCCLSSRSPLGGVAGEGGRAWRPTPEIKVQRRIKHPARHLFFLRSALHSSSQTRRRTGSFLFCAPAAPLYPLLALRRHAYATTRGSSPSRARDAMRRGPSFAQTRATPAQPRTPGACTSAGLGLGRARAAQRPLTRAVSARAGAKKKRRRWCGARRRKSGPRLQLASCLRATPGVAVTSYPTE
jgi:hypothetical protein